MATTQIAFGELGQPGAQIPNSTLVVDDSVDCESFAPTTSNQRTTITSASDRVQAARVATDTAVYVSFGTSLPNASSDTIRFLVPAHAIAYFLVPAGSKAAVVSLT